MAANVPDTEMHWSRAWPAPTGQPIKSAPIKAVGGNSEAYSA
jgi:hypothetical protein